MPGAEMGTLRAAGLLTRLDSTGFLWRHLVYTIVVERTSVVNVTNTHVRTNPHLRIYP